MVPFQLTSAISARVTCSVYLEPTSCISAHAVTDLEPKTRVGSSRVMQLSCYRKQTLSGLGSQSRIQGKGGLGDAGRSLVMSNNMIHETVCK